MAGKISLGSGFDAFQTQPFRHEQQFLAQGLGCFLGISMGFEVGGIGAQYTCLPVSLQADAGGKAVAHQEGQDIVAVFALLGGRVNLNAVMEIEQPFGPGALPYEGIERRDQGRAAGLAREFGVAVDVGLMLPILHGSRG